MSTVSGDSLSVVAVDPANFPTRTTMQEEKKVDSNESGLEKEQEEEHREQPQDENDQLLLESVESDEFETPALWKKLWDSMNPAVCLSPTMACNAVLFDDDDDVVEYNRIIPPLLRDMKHAGKTRTAALQRLYRFTDRDRHKNRVPVVCSTRFHSLDALIPCLAVDVAAADRRQALLVLNNLCIPSENKRTVLLGPSRDELLTALLQVLHQKLPECHLVVACLFNLSFYEEAKGVLLNYVPTVSLQHSDQETPEEYTFSQPTEKRDSFLRILERVTSEFVPYYVQHKTATMYNERRQNVQPASVESSMLRWTFCLLRNLASNPDHAVLLATTTRFPAAALEILRVVRHTDLSHWSHDSLPEACLVFWVWLVQASEEACRHLQKVFGEDEELSAVKILEPLVTQQGIQGVRARVVTSCLLANKVDDPSIEEKLRSLASF